MENLNNSTSANGGRYGNSLCYPADCYLLRKCLIALVNKYAPEEVVPAKAAANGPAPVPGNILAAISAAVTVVTQGKGKLLR